jgi:hypothetical protein
MVHVRGSTGYTLAKVWIAAAVLFHGEQFRDDTGVIAKLRKDAICDSGHRGRMSILEATKLWSE